MQIETPPIQWAVEGMLPEGLNLLAAKPKVGKSTIALDFGIGVANGEVLLGKYQANQGRVLYISPDDKAVNRTQERLRHRLQGDRLPNTFQYALDWNTIAKNDTGLEELADYVMAYPDGEVKLIIVDVLPNILPPYREDAQAYQVMYDFLPPLKDFAHEYHLCVLALAHKNKANGTGGGLLDGIYGNVALSAIADNILVMDELQDKKRILRTKGKDIQEDDFYLAYNRETEQSVIGDTSEIAIDSTRKPANSKAIQILSALPACTSLRSSVIETTLVEEYGLPIGTAKSAVREIRTGGLIDIPYYKETGLYRLPQKSVCAA